MNKTIKRGGEPKQEMKFLLLIIVVAISFTVTITQVSTMFDFFIIQMHFLKTWHTFPMTNNNLP